MADDLGVRILHLLLTRPRLMSELREITKNFVEDERELELKLKQLRRENLIYRVRWKYFIQGRVVVELAIREQLQSPEIPSGPLGDFVRNLAAGVKLDLPLEDAWKMAGKTLGAGPLER